MRLRKTYLQSLSEPQEWFLEELAADAQWWVLPEVANGAVTGKTLIEFFVDPGHAGRAAVLFGQFRRQSNFEVALVKSFDAELLRLMAGVPASQKVAAHLFRRFEPARLDQPRNADFRQGLAADGATLWDMSDGFFSGPAEVEAMIQKGHLWVLERGGDLLGCGVTTPLGHGSDAVDIGILVSAEFRGNGFGAVIASQLGERVLQMGLRPICGCAAHNVASRRALEKAGFISAHELLRFDIL